MIGLEGNLSSTSTYGGPDRTESGFSRGTVDLDLKARGNPTISSTLGDQAGCRCHRKVWVAFTCSAASPGLFYGSWIGFTTLRLERAEGYFLLDRNKISFPDLRFYGPNARIQASGDFLFPHHEIDFKVQVKYLERAVNPISTALSPLFKPLIDSLEVDLWGPITKPQWRFSMDPSNIFETPSFSSRPIDPFSGEEDKESKAEIP